jgi:prolipoprotein diacylglyceryl transferase
MRPILFYVGEYGVRSYSLILFGAVIAGIFVMLVRGKDRGLPAQRIVTFCAGAILFGLLGSRLYEAALHWGRYAGEPDGALRVWFEGGLAAPGALVGTVLWAVVYARRTGFRLLTWLDVMAPVVLLVEGLMRWGCLLAGCCYGRETSAPWGLYLPDQDGHWATRYPTQILHSAVALAMAAVLWRLDRRRWRAGRLFWLFLACYGLDHAILDFWRADAVPGWGGLTLKQWLGLAAVGVGCIGWLWPDRSAVTEFRQRTSAKGRVRWWPLIATTALTLFMFGCGYRSIDVQVGNSGAVAVHVVTAFAQGDDPNSIPDCATQENFFKDDVRPASASCSSYTDQEAKLAGCECVLTYEHPADFSSAFQITGEVSGSRQSALTANLQELPDRYRLSMHIRPEMLWTRYSEGSDGSAQRDFGPMTLSARMPGPILDHSEPQIAGLERVDVGDREIRWQFTGGGPDSSEGPVFSVAVESRRGIGAFALTALPWFLLAAGALLLFGIGVAVRRTTPGSADRRPEPRARDGRPTPPALPRSAGGAAGATVITRQKPVAATDLAGMHPVRHAASGYPSEGDILGKYVIRERVGQGAMATVYRARHIVLGHNVALKVMAPHLTSDPDFVRRFNREGRLLAGLSHPNIVAVHDAGEDRGFYYLAMDFIEGESLDKRLARKGTLPAGEVIWIGQGVTRALAYAHGRGLIHRDIKPGNVLMGRDRTLKVADFGIATLIGQVTMMAGTPGYMPPELAQGRADQRSDVYSTGALLYHLLTGHSPAPDTSGQVVSPDRIAQATPPTLARIILRALQVDPARRYQTAGEMEQDLDRARAESG